MAYDRVLVEWMIEGLHLVWRIGADAEVSLASMKLRNAEATAQCYS